ncbi:MAG: 50S ribosomal protein L33 [Candidatus Spechtbacterales bacterium]|nr:50S ribosomal protein L33 [Candidatus Spechtbacterales bacterium]
MSQDNLVRLKCKDCDTINYYTTKNKKSVERKIELKKFCKQCKKHRKHKETKKKG